MIGKLIRWWCFARSFGAIRQPGGIFPSQAEIDAYVTRESNG